MASERSDCLEKSEVKKRKVDDYQNGTEKSIFSRFAITRVLTDNSRSKMICMEGQIEEKTAVIILEKTPFSKENAEQILSGEIEVKAGLVNDIYSNYDLLVKTDLNAIKASLIHPATERHIEKYRAQSLFLLEETPADYQRITLPYLEAEKFTVQWVYNILDKKCEADRIVYEDPDQEIGFILLPDMKWDTKQVNDLYLVAIVHERGVKSLRDLTAAYLPLLRNVLHKGRVALKEKYGIGADKLRIYVHYQPSYYHFHVHFTSVEFEAPGTGVERAHLLTDIIDNIELDGNYYQKKTLTFLAKENEGLCKKFMESKRG